MTDSTHGSVSLSVRSTALGKKWYTINRFIEYIVDIDLETDADDFSFTISNPECIFSGLISTNDRVRIKINKTGIMLGIVDQVIYHGSNNGNTIEVHGRDKALLLIDNDVKSTTKKNLKPVNYINERCNKFGIKYKNKKPIPLIKKYEIDGGSEMAIIIDMLNKSKQKLWYIYDTLYSGSWNLNGEIKWRFTRGVKAANRGIDIEDITLNEDIKNLISKEIIYGRQDDDHKISGSYTLKVCNNRGIVKLKTITDSDTKSSSKLSKQAETDILDELRDAYTIRLIVDSKNHVIMPNTVCRIIDRFIGINCTMFIRAVQYQKGSSGTKCEITCIPDSRTLKKLMNTSKITYSLASTDETKRNAKIKSLLNKYSKKW